MCKHQNIIKVEEMNIVTTTYRKLPSGKYKLERGSTTSGRTGVVKWVCLDCVQKIDPPLSKNIVLAS